MAIPFFRKGPEAPSAANHGKPTKKPTPADPHTSTMDFTQGGDVRALAAAANRIRVDELSDADHPAVEEAAILFANGSDDAAAATLEAALDGGDRGNETLWAMLFDLYRICGKREAFEQRGVFFATQFGRSPPAWGGAEAATKAVPRDATPSISLTGMLGASAGKQFEQISKIAAKAGKLKIDLARLRGADEAGCEQLVGLLHSLRQLRVKVVLANARTMLPMIESHATAGRREGRAIWLMVLELLQALSEAQRFDDVALDYAITFEESPPSYEAPPASVAPSMLNAAQPAAAAGGLELLPLDGDSNHFSLEGEINSSQGEAIRSLAKYAADRQAVEVDASGLVRLDFVSAGNLFNVLVQLQKQGKLCTFLQVNAMVGALLRVMGVHQVATLEMRKL